MDWGTVVLGVAGIAGTYAGARAQSRSAERIAETDRRQRRLEDAYLDLLGMVGEADDWSALLWRHLGGELPNGERDAYPPRLAIDSVATRGSLSAYWSPRMRELVDEFAAQALEQRAVRYERQAARTRLDGSGEPVPAIVESLNRATAARNGLIELAGEIRERVAAELTGSPSSRRRWRPD